MKKINIIIIVGFLILFGNIASSITTNESDIKIINKELLISKPVIRYIDEYVSIFIEELESYKIEPGKPILPIITNVFTIPLGSTICDVSINNIYDYIILPKKILPASKQLISDDLYNSRLSETIINKNIYDTSKLYPSESYTISKGSGLFKGEHVLFVNLKINTQYSPLENKLYYPSKIDIKIEYKLPESKIIKSDNYDMVIITPNEFSQTIQSLIEHKNSKNVRTFLKTTEEIYSEYDGRDEAESIKLFIKGAIEDFNIKYVLLIGNINKIPIRKTFGFWYEETDIPSDLYYADIYDENASFCTWDTNQNNIFGEFICDDVEFYDFIDHVDLYPDVGVGRIPCKNQKELEIVIDKIIIYESQIFDSDWFNNIILMGGDTYPGIGFFEGEFITSQISENLQGFNFIKLWTSLNNFNVFQINKAINQGASFMSYSGHGLERLFGTSPPNEQRTISYNDFYILGLSNGNKLPIIFLDACLTASLDYKWYLWDYPCIAWSFLKHRNGGSIATIGATRPSYLWISGNSGNWILPGGAPVLNINFFKSYEPGAILSEMFIDALNQYLNYNFKDAYLLEEFVILGDPSLKAGGYY